MIANQLSNLSELNLMAQRLIEPVMYGTFADDAHYLGALDILLAATNETENRINFFMNQILPNVNHQHFLDVGVGDGVLSKMIGLHFHKTTLIDNSQKALDCVDKADFSAPKTLTKIKASIADVMLPVNEYDLAVLSHTLYYLDAKQWMPVIHKVFNALKTNGLMVIVLNGGLDKDQLAHEFRGQTIDVESLVRDCSNQLEVDAIQVIFERVVFQTQALLPMLHIANLHLYDVQGKTDKKNMIDFLQARRNKLNQLFQFFVYQKYILIRKRIL